MFLRAPLQCRAAPLKQVPSVPAGHGVGLPLSRPLPRGIWRAVAPSAPRLRHRSQPDQHKGDASGARHSAAGGHSASDNLFHLTAAPDASPLYRAPPGPWLPSPLLSLHLQPQRLTPSYSRSTLLSEQLLPDLSPALTGAHPRRWRARTCLTRTEASPPRECRGPF